jgi:hypothetical protein
MAVCSLILPRRHGSCGFDPFVAGQSIFVSRDFGNMFSLRFITETKLEAVKRAYLTGLLCYILGQGFVIWF